MNFLDIFLGILLMVELFKGLKNGFFAEIGSIAGLFIGFFAASELNGPFSHLLADVFSMGHAWSSILGFIVPFCAFYVGVLLLAGTFSHIFKTFSLGWMNRLAGGAFNLLKCALILSIFLNLYELADRNRRLIGPERAESSALYEPLLEVAPALIPSFLNLSSGSKEKDNNDSKIHDV